MSPSSPPPTVSVVIPCFNQGAFLGDALDSVLTQSYPRLEVVVVDDGSTDPATVSAIAAAPRRDPRIAAVRTTNLGLPGARNLGVRSSHGDYVLPLDADDRLAPQFLARTASVLDADPRCGIVYTDVQYFGASRARWVTPEFDLVGLLCSNLMTATSLYRRRCWDEVGGYRESMREGFEDWDFWISICERGWTARRLGEPLFCYRKHRRGSMLSQTQRQRNAIYRQICANHRQTYVDHLVEVLARKDAMFFEQLQAKHWYEIRFGWLARALGWLGRLSPRQL